MGELEFCFLGNLGVFVGTYCAWLRDRHVVTFGIFLAPGLWRCLRSNMSMKRSRQMCPLNATKTKTLPDSTPPIKECLPLWHDRYIHIATVYSDLCHLIARLFLHTGSFCCDSQPQRAIGSKRISDTPKLRWLPRPGETLCRNNGTIPNKPGKLTKDQCLQFVVPTQLKSGLER